MAIPASASPAVFSWHDVRGLAAGIYNTEPRTPQSTIPTSFRQWCEEVLKPAVLA